MRSGRRIPRRAGPWPGPPAPAEPADADLALAELYQLHYRPLVRMAALLAPDLATAERIVQDAFAAVHSAWPGYWHWQDADATLCLLRRLVVDRSRAVPPGSRPGIPAWCPRCGRCPPGSARSWCCDTSPTCRRTRSRRRPASARMRSAVRSRWRSPRCERSCPRPTESREPRPPGAAAPGRAPAGRTRPRRLGAPWCAAT